MFVNIRQVRPTDVTELTRRVYEQGLVQRYRQIPGFVAYHVVESTDGTWTSISIFETEAGARESNRIALEWGNANAADLSDEPPVITTGTLAITQLDQPGRLAA